MNIFGKWHLGFCNWSYTPTERGFDTFYESCLTYGGYDFRNNRKPDFDAKGTYSTNGGPTVSGGNNWPLRGNKTTLWEGGTRGAAFVHSPLLANPGTVSHSLIHTTDWMSTVVNVAGGSPPKNSDGFNQWEAINGQSNPVRKEMIYNINYNKHRGLQAGIRIRNYKLLLGDPGPGEWTPPPESSNDLEGIKEENPSENILRLSDQFSELWSYKRHMKYLKEMIFKCFNLKCISNILKIYKEANDSIIDRKYRQKIIDVIKRNRKSYRKFLRKFGVWDKTENKIMILKKRRIWHKKSLDYDLTVFNLKKYVAKNDVSILILRHI
ncbi:Arylsulfatase B, partial [Armadillidium nasatum]